MNRGMRSGLPRAQYNAPSEERVTLPPLVQGGKWQLVGDATWSSATVCQLTPSSGSKNGTAWLAERVPLDGLEFTLSATMAVDGINIVLGDPGLGDNPSIAGGSAHGPWVNFETFNSTSWGGLGGVGSYVQLAHRQFAASNYYGGSRWPGLSGAPSANLQGAMFFKATKSSIDGYYLIEAGWGAVGDVRGIVPGPDTVYLGFQAGTGGSFGLQSITGLVGVSR